MKLIFLRHCGSDHFRVEILKDLFFKMTLSLYPGLTPVHFPGLPPEFMQAIVHQISHQAAAMAAAASAGHPAQMVSGPASTPNAEATAFSQPPHPAQARVVITRPSFSPRIPQPMGTRGATINLRATVPTGPQPGQVHQHRVVRELTTCRAVTHKYFITDRCFLD